MPLTFHAGDLDSPDVRELVESHYAELRAISPPDACHVLPSVGLKHPAVTFWSVRDGGDLVGMGALKELAPDHGEVKSLRAAAVGRGVGRATLRHIVAEGRSRGYARLSLETGSTEPFAPALRLYQSEGFRLYQSEGFQPWGPFGDYLDIPFSCFLTRRL